MKNKELPELFDDMRLEIGMHDGTLVQCSFRQENCRIVFCHSDKNGIILLGNKALPGDVDSGIEAMLWFLEDPKTDYYLPDNMVEYMLTLRKNLRKVKYGNLNFQLQNTTTSKTVTWGRMRYFYVPGYSNSTTLTGSLQIPGVSSSTSFQFFTKRGKEAIEFIRTFPNYGNQVLSLDTEEQVRNFVNEYQQDMLGSQEFKQDSNIFKLLRGSQ